MQNYSVPTKILGTVKFMSINKDATIFFSRQVIPFFHLLIYSLKVFTYTSKASIPLAVILQIV